MAKGQVLTRVKQKYEPILAQKKADKYSIRIIVDEADLTHSLR